MRLLLFSKTFLLALVACLLAYALTPLGIVGFFKALALGVAASILFAVFYPDVRGVKSGDRVAVASASVLPIFVQRLGTALSSGKKNAQLRIQFENGSEAMAILESYEGLLSPPQVRIVYEEKLAE